MLGAEAGLVGVMAWPKESLKRRTGANGQRPPRNAEFLLCLVCPKDKCDALVGDLEERYPSMCQKFGEDRARLWYWWQVIRCLAPLIFEGVKILSGIGKMVEVFWKLRQ
jgi:hypothetical protein